jgi:hypothetical protein
MSGLPWFRLYSRIIDDDKLRLLAFEDRWHFVALCCLKSDGLLDEADSDIRTRRIAVKLGVQVRELDEIGRRLREVELVDEALNPVAWDELQYRSDNSTERVKEWRKKQRKQRGNKVQRCSNVSVTVQETDEDTETEELEAKASCASGDALAPEHVIAVWNDEIAPALGKPKVRKLTPERRVRLRARIAGFTTDEFREVIANIRASPFLRGETGWHGFSFDWFTKKANFLKILEGNYNG